MPCENFIEHFSSLPKSIRVIAYILCFKPQSRFTSLVVNAEEYSAALEVSIRASQAIDFSDEIARLKNNTTVQTKSVLKSLDP